jgi:predicted DNA-binding transcriptional regulator AlpA
MGMEWLVTAESEPVKASSWDRLQDELLDALTRVPSIHGVVGWGRIGRLGAVYSVEGDSIDEAVGPAMKAFVRALKMVGGPPPAGVSVESFTEEDLEPSPIRVVRERGRPTPTQLLTASEVGDLLGVSRQRVYQLIGEHMDFPRPWSQVRGRALYDRAAVEQWRSSWARRPGRPRKLDA